MPSNPAPDAILFDLDGVIIDSHHQHEKAWEVWATESSICLPDGFFKKSFGMRNETVLPDLLGIKGPPEKIFQMGFRKEEIYRDILKTTGLVPLPGVLDFLTLLRDASIPCAVATSTPRVNLDVVMQMTDLAPYFQAMITGSDVSRGKPDPEVFLKAAAALDADPTRCLVVEDAHVGIHAALAANCRVLAVATTHPIDSLHEATIALPDLTHVSLALIQSLFSLALP